MAILGEVLKSRIRKEIRDRTEEILTSVRAVQEALDRHREVLEKLLEATERGGIPDKSELRKSTGKLVRSERKLNDSIHRWIAFMEKTVEELKG